MIFPAGYLEAFAVTLGVEGGYVDNPQDPGRATRWGITEAVAREADYRGPMRDLPQSVAQEIGYQRYWLRYNVGALPPPLCVVIFDSVYNSGDLGVKWLQMALGFTGGDVDGVLGTQTAHAATLIEPAKLSGLVMAQRLLGLAEMERWPDFGRGWTRRCARVLQAALRTGEQTHGQKPG